MKVEPAFNLRICALRTVGRRDGGRGGRRACRSSAASDGKAPRTARGERTLRKILDAARDEFGERGFSDSSIVGITQRAGVALGTFYTYFDSKEAVFQALVRDMSAQVRDHVAPAFKDATDALDGERRALESFLQLRAQAPRRLPDHRRSGVRRARAPIASIMKRPRRASRRASRPRATRARSRPTSPIDDLDILAWASMGANVFLGLKFEVWSSADAKRVAEVTNRLLRKGLAA